MMLNQDVWGREGLWTQGVHDSIEQTYHAYRAYGYEPFIEGIKSCWKPIEYKYFRKLLGYYYYKPQRYPIKYDGMKPMSRDHVIYSLLAFYYSGMSKHKIFNYGKRLPFLIGNNIGMTMTPKLWLWIRLLSGKKIGYLYYPLVLSAMINALIKNTIVEAISKFGFAKNEEHQSTFEPVFKDKKTKLQLFLGSLYYPTYAVKLTANMLNVIPENWFVKQARKLALKMVPRYNYVLKMLLKQRLTVCETMDLKNYKSMTGDRWSDQLNRIWSHRPLYIIENKFPDKNYTIANALDKDYALKLLELNGQL